MSIENIELEDNSVSVRQNFTTEVEEALNKQIAIELTASYHYLALVNFFNKIF